MGVVVVDAADIGVGHDYEGEVSQGMEAVGQSDREEGEGEVGRREEGGLGEWWAAMSGAYGVSYICPWRQKAI